MSCMSLVSTQQSSLDDIIFTPSSVPLAGDYSSFFECQRDDAESESESVPRRPPKLGKYLGSGSYSSVYRNPYNLNTVFKVFKQHPYYLRETFALDQLDKIIKSCPENWAKTQRHCTINHKINQKIHKNGRKETFIIELSKAAGQSGSILSRDRATKSKLLGRAISSPCCLIMMQKLLIGLSFLHNNGFVHRDISPSNIFYHRRSNSAAIIDLGFLTKYDTCSIGGVSMHGTRSTMCYRLGTFDVMAPELHGLRRLIDLKPHAYVHDSPSADLYALAATMFFVTFGCYPHFIHTKVRFDLDSPPHHSRSLDPRERLYQQEVEKTVRCTRQEHVARVRSLQDYISNHDHREEEGICSRRGVRQMVKYVQHLLNLGQPNRASVEHEIWSDLKKMGFSLTEAYGIGMAIDLILEVYAVDRSSLAFLIVIINKGTLSYFTEASKDPELLWQDVPKSTKICVEIKAFFTKALHIDYNKRYHSAYDMKIHLENLMSCRPNKSRSCQSVKKKPRALVVDSFC